LQRPVYSDMVLSMVRLKEGPAMRLVAVDRPSSVPWLYREK